MLHLINKLIGRSFMDDKPTTRRIALKTGFSLLAATGAVSIAARAKAQSAKADPSTVAYQTKPSNGQQCSTCTSFIAPAGCVLVSGTISPSGWCELYSPKS
jgi:hypothetical protein